MEVVCVVNSWLLAGDYCEAALGSDRMVWGLKFGRMGVEKAKAGVLPDLFSMRYLRSSLALAVATVVFVPVSAAEALSVEERLNRIEATLQRLEARLGATVTADELAPTVKDVSALKRQLGAASSPGVVLKAGGKEERLTIGGFIHAQAEAGDAPDSRYTGIYDRVLLRRARMTVTGAFAEKFRFVMQSDFGNNAVAGNTSYRAHLTDAFVAWAPSEAAMVQVGQFKTPFGYEQLLADTKLLAVERSLPNDLLTVGRQIGIGVSGELAHRKFGYTVALFNGNGVNNGNNDNDQFMYAGRLTAAPYRAAGRALAVAVNGYRSRDTGSAFAGVRTAWGADAQYTQGRLGLAAEYLNSRQDRVTGVDTRADGFTLQGTWFFVPDVWQGLLRYERHDGNTATPGTTSTDWVLGVNYSIKGDDLRLFFNYVLGDPAGPAARQGRFLSRLQLIF